MNIIGFAEWLQGEMNVREMTKADLVRASGISQSQISKILGMQSPPGKKSLKAIAQAFHLPPEYVFRIAGLLPDQQEPDDLRKKILDYKLAELSDDELERVIEYIEFLQHRKQDIKINREGVAPPEVLKSKVRT